ncbi:MAG TPA: ATP-binding protein [Flavobacteriales bacterium]
MASNAEQRSTGPGRNGTWPVEGWTEKRLLKSIYVSTVLLLLVLLFTLYRSMQRYSDANEVIRRSNFLLIELQETLFALKDAETGSRGFVLTHDTSFLRPFNQAQAMIERSIQRMDSASTSVQDRARVDSLRSLSADLFRRIQGQLLLERGSEPGLQGTELERLRDTRAVMDRIKGNRTRMVHEIEGLLEHYRFQEQASRWRTPLMLAVYAAMALLATALLLWRLFRALGLAEKAEQEVHQKVLQLDREMKTRDFAERSLRRVLDSSTSSIMLFRSVRDPTGAIVDFEWLLLNRTAEQLMGRSAESLVGQHLRKVHPHLSDERLFRSLIEVVEGGGPLMEERVSSEREGEWFSVHAVRLLDGFVITYTDISDRKRAQDVLMESDRLAITGRIARTIAHEVRNPLTNLRMALEQLLDELGTEQVEAAGPYVEILKRNIERISRLITDLLESSKPRELDPEPSEVSAVLRSALHAVQDRLDLQQMIGALEVEKGLPRVMMDPDMVQLALANICINAVEAMEPGKGRLSLSARALNGGVTIQVRDNGKGIEPQNIQRLFEAFYSSRSGGMGLGLTTARTILNAHGVHLNVESEVGVGTVFNIAFPASAVVSA